MCAHICSIAIIYKNQGKFLEALELFNKSLATKEKVLSCEHPDAAATQDNIGLVLRAQRKLSEALEMHQKALKTRVAALGPEHLDVATTNSSPVPLSLLFSCVVPMIVVILQHCPCAQSTRQF